MKRLLLSAISCICMLGASAQTGLDFWFAAPEVSQNAASNFDRPIFLHLTAGAVAANVVLSQPAGGGMPTLSIVVPANTTVSYDLTAYTIDLECAPSDMTLNSGLHIAADNPITAVYEVRSTNYNNSAYFTLHGENALGTSFYIPGQNSFSNNTAYTPAPRNTFDIVASENSTVVTILPSANILGHASGTPFTIILNQGQTYSAAAVTSIAAAHLHGSRVTSSKPISITVKDDQIGMGTNYDLSGDQIVPVSKLDTHYIAMYGNVTTPNSDSVYVTATVTGTDIYVDSAWAATLVAGQTFRIPVPSLGSVDITGTFPFYAYQISGYGREAGGALLPPVSAKNVNRAQFYQASSQNFFVDLLVPSVGIGSFTVNGAGGVITAPMFNVVNWTGGVWYSARVSLPVATYPRGSVVTIQNSAANFQATFVGGQTGTNAAGIFSYVGGNFDPPVYPPTAGTSTGAVVPVSDAAGNIIKVVSPVTGLLVDSTITISYTALPARDSGRICVGSPISLFVETIPGASYLWTGPNGFVSTLQNPVKPVSVAADSGIYTILVTTPSFSYAQNILVMVHPYPVVNLGGNDSLCSGTNNRMFNTSYFAGDVVSYLWSTTATTPTYTSLVPGRYWLRITNSGCAATDTLLVMHFPTPIVNLGRDSSYCIGDTITLFNPQPPYFAYNWHKLGDATVLSDTSTLAVSEIASYELIVRDTFYNTPTLGCADTDVVSISFSPPIPVELGPTVFNCAGASEVLRSVYSYDSTIYLWSTGGIDSTETVSLSGRYGLMVVRNGCAVVDSVDVQIIYDTFTLYNFDTAVCLGNNVQGKVTTNPAATVQWLPTAGILNSRTHEPLITPDTSAMYYVRIMIPGCPTLVDSFKIDVEPQPLPYIGGNRNVCMYESININTLVEPRWYTDYKFKWTPSVNLNYDSVQSVMFTAGTSGKIYVTVTTQAGCRGMDSAEIYVRPGDFATVSPMDTFLCPNDSIRLVASGGITYDWSPRIYLSDTASATPMAHAITTQEYTMIATNIYGCRDTIKNIIRVHPAGSINMPDSAVIYPGESYQMNPMSNCTNFTWFPPTGLSEQYIANPIAKPDLSSMYILYGLTENNCKVIDTINIIVEAEALLAMPNAFAPASATNGVFKPIKRGSANLNYLRIFNRWGTMVFESTDINKGWDGTFNGTPQPFGVYLYDLEAVGTSGRAFRKSGNVTLIR